MVPKTEENQEEENILEWKQKHNRHTHTYTHTDKHTALKKQRFLEEKKIPREKKRKGRFVEKIQREDSSRRFVEKIRSEDSKRRFQEKILREDSSRRRRFVVKKKIRREEQLRKA